MMRDLTCMGVRHDDWMAVCRGRLPEDVLERLIEALWQRAANRNRAENERNSRLHISGGCATHRDFK